MSTAAEVNSTHPIQPRIAEFRIARESEGYEFGGRLHGAIRFTSEFRKRTDGRRFAIQGAHGQRWSGVARFRGAELWLTEIEPAIEAPEVAGVEPRADGRYSYMAPVLSSPLHVQRQHDSRTGKRAQRRMNKPWAGSGR